VIRTLAGSRIGPRQHHSRPAATPEAWSETGRGSFRTRRRCLRKRPADPWASRPKPARSIESRSDPLVLPAMMGLLALIPKHSQSAYLQGLIHLAATVQGRPFYLTPLLIAVAYFLARPLRTKSS